MTFAIVLLAALAPPTVGAAIAVLFILAEDAREWYNARGIAQRAPQTAVCTVAAERAFFGTSNALALVEASQAAMDAGKLDALTECFPTLRASYPCDWTDAEVDAEAERLVNAALCSWCESPCTISATTGLDLRPILRCDCGEMERVFEVDTSGLCSVIHAAHRFTREPIALRVIPETEGTDSVEGLHPEVFEQMVSREHEVWPSLQA